MSRSQKIDNLCLNDVGVLILIDQQMQETTRKYLQNIRMIQKQPPAVNQQIVEIHHTEISLFLLVATGNLMDIRTEMHKEGVS
ncbi:MAG: hypothetical protein BWX99_02487 [Deltaproteobacteria bacterium ADurb.Bin151]|nr:MAG: hypothetical protein BWX99_02487 [Deltaproteobacteria bacterium ADurb.Bin151]